MKYQTLDRYLVAFAMLSVVAWRVEYLKTAARATPNAPCSNYYQPHEWQAIVDLRHSPTRRPRTTPDDARVHMPGRSTWRLHQQAFPRPTRLPCPLARHEPIRNHRRGLPNIRPPRLVGYKKARSLSHEKATSWKLIPRWRLQAGR